MNNIDWNDYRHAKFLQSLSLTLNELKILNLFSKRPNFGTDASIEHIQKITLVSPKRSINSSNILTQEKISIKI